MPGKPVLDTLPGSLPTNPIPGDADVISVAKSFESILNGLQAEHFVGDAIWRDHFALTGTLRTFYSSNCIATAWKETATSRQLGKVTLDPASATVHRHFTGPAWIDFNFSFETHSVPRSSCIGIASIVPNETGDWRIWVLRTILQLFEGLPDVDTLEPHQRDAAGHDGDGMLDCIVVGGGPCGLATAGRMKAMGLSYVLIDKHKRVGDSWKTRYESVRLHTVRAWAHLPFDETFPDSYQEFLTTSDLARGYNDWVKKFNINVWQDTELVSGSWNANDRTWILDIVRAGEAQQISCRHVVLAVGNGGQIPKMPNFQRREDFEGTVMHSVEYQHAREWKGKKCVVVGTANTAHDIANDMLEAGCASVTMVQRGKTYVVPAAHYHKAIRPIYNSHTPTNVSDISFLTLPHRTAHLLALATSTALASASSPYYTALERADFRVERYGSFPSRIFDVHGGHYIDVGVSAKIAAGQIKAKSDAGVARYTTRGLGFDDESELEADVVVFATGFEVGMGALLGRWFGDGVAARAEEVGGLDGEGESGGVIRPTGHPGLWFIGISLGMARYQSRFIALQVAADLKGTALPMYSKKFPIRKNEGI